MATRPRCWTPYVATLFLCLTVIATYPIVVAPASLAFFTHADALLNMWILAWDAHALTHHAAHLFDTNIFFPEPRTLAYSETLLGYLPIFGPILWLGGSPALANNAILLFSFTASGVAMYLLARHLTGREWPAIAAGIAYAFVPYRFVHIPQIQLEAMEWIPLAFLCLHLFVERGHIKYAIGLAASVAMEAYCCVYYSLFLTVALVVGGPILLLAEGRRGLGRKLGILALAGGLAAAVVAPLAGEYLRVHQTRKLERPIEEIAQRSAVPATYLASTSRVDQRLWMTTLAPPRDYLFPGMLPLALAAVGLVVAFARRYRATRLAIGRRRIVVTYAAIAVVGLAASFGPLGLGGFSLYRVLDFGLPLLQGLRQTSRFGVLAIFGVSVLAALGAAALETPLRRMSAAGPIALAGLIFLELAVAPLRTDRPQGDALMRVPAVPPVYTWLAQQPGAFAIVELPYANEGQMWQNAGYVYWSTVHWHGLVDAYSGFAPPDYASLRRILDRFPDEISRQALLQRHVCYVIVHHDLYRDWNHPLNYARIGRTPWLQEVAQFPDVDVFRVSPPLGMDWDADR
jgi:hypothetical protein